MAVPLLGFNGFCITQEGCGLTLVYIFFFFGTLCFVLSVVGLVGLAVCCISSCYIFFFFGYSVFSLLASESLGPPTSPRLRKSKSLPCEG